MIHLTVFIPLAIGGAITAVWRDYKKKKVPNQEVLMIGDGAPIVVENCLPETVKQFDDIAEISHYQRVSYYALAFSTAGAWFYSPAGFLAIPLLGYNGYHFAKMLKNSNSSDRSSPLTVFESIGVGGTMLTGHSALSSLVLSGSFTMRKLLLQGSNIAHLDPNTFLNMKQARAWVLREGIEVEILVSELQEGDVFVLHDGDIVASKGVVVSGVGTVRQYSLQRTMKSIYKQEGDEVYPFTQVESGCLHVKY